MPARQLSLPGFEPADILDNLFFAYRLAPESFSRMVHIRDELCRECGLRGVPISPQRLHISLFGVCECHSLPEGLIETAQRAAASVAIPPFDVVFDRASSFITEGTRGPWFC